MLLGKDGENGGITRHFRGWIRHFERVCDLLDHSKLLQRERNAERKQKAMNRKKNSVDFQLKSLPTNARKYK
jgi:hypothetical protein